MATKKPRAPKGSGSHGESPLPNVNPAVADPATPDQSPPFPIVAIGASAGGLEAFTRLLAGLPPDTGMAFVVLQHLSPLHQSMLSEILGRSTPMPVLEAREGMRVERDHVFVIPPAKDMTFARGCLQLAPRPDKRSQLRPIDHFMRSLAEEHGHKSVGVVLSGTGSDGTLGLQEIKAAGGVTFAQDNTAEQSSMPRSAIAAGAVDFVLPADEIARELVRIARHAFVILAPGEEMEAIEAQPAFGKVLEKLREQTNVDFTNYKRNTLFRRITRRMLLHRLGSMQDYVKLIDSNAEEVDALYSDVLIGVTSFFRNPESYEMLKADVFPKLTAERNRNDPVRIWVMGCSTGEEAYSIAMAFTEHLEETGRRSPLQVFATDLNARGIDRARAGVYPKGIEQDVSAERLRRFFAEIDGHYRIAKPIRDMCVFARQNMLADPPFSRLDLVSCRNVLIYLEPPLQQRLIPMMHYALRDHGFLWLGGSETIGTYRDLFELKEPRHKVYAKKPGIRPQLPIAAFPRRWEAPAPGGAAAPRDPAGEVHKEADRLVLARYSPPGVVVSPGMDILQFRGDTSPYLSPAPGRATLDLMKMLREGLLVAVRGAVARAQRENMAVRESAVRVKSNGGWREVDVLVVPLKGNGSEGSLLVLFEESGQAVEARAREVSAQAQAESERAALGQDGAGREKEIARLKQELVATREYLQSVIEQQEAANEELQSANEEVQSANEELQSINEELETSKEEIQSANEELATVNDELQDRNTELSQSNNDLLNLFTSVQMPIVMLGSNLRIRRFTPAAEKLLNLIPSDVGRPVGDLKMRIAVPDLESLIADVIDDMAPHERDIRDEAGRWFSLRIRPYRTLENRIEGAVMVLVDIDSQKRAAQALLEIDRGRNEFLAMLAHELRNPLAGVRNAARLLESTSKPAIMAEARAIIERQSAHMVRMVDDLLDVSRLTQGKIHLNLAPVELSQMLRRIVDATDPVRRARRQALELSIPPQPVWVEGDAMRLEQVLANLLDNAAKFCPQGGRAWLSLSQEPGARGEAATAMIRLRDNGNGIDPEILPHIFELFVQANRYLPDGPAGIGLGLTLARRLVQLHGGTIEAASGGNGVGSEFTIRLPLPQHEAGVAPASPAVRTGSPAAPRKVLIVDDNEDAAESMRLLLDMAGHEVRVVHLGGEALPAAREFGPDVILLDIGLPDMDGYRVAGELRAAPTLADVVIVACTGYGRGEDVERSRRAGIDHHMTKPVDPDALMPIIGKARPQRP